METKHPVEYTYVKEIIEEINKHLFSTDFVHTNKISLNYEETTDFFSGIYPITWEQSASAMDDEIELIIDGFEVIIHDEENSYRGRHRYIHSPSPNTIKFELNGSKGNCYVDTYITVMSEPYEILQDKQIKILRKGYSGYHYDFEDSVIAYNNKEIIPFLVNQFLKIGYFRDTGNFIDLLRFSKDSEENGKFKRDTICISFDKDGFKTLSANKEAQDILHKLNSILIKK